MTNQMNDFMYTANPEASASIHDDGMVILHVGSGHLYTSNRTGARIWRGVERRLPVAAMAQEISGEYQIAHSEACRHVARFLKEMEQHSLVRKEARL